MPDDVLTTGQLRDLPAEHREFLSGLIESEETPTTETPEAPATPPADTATDEAAPKESSEATEAETDKGTQEATPPASPAPTPALELKALPEAIRSKIARNEALTPADWQEIDKGWLLQADYTRKTQEASDVRKQAEADKRDAEVYRRIAKSQKAVDAALKALEAGDDGDQDSTDDDVFDPLTATPEQAKAWKQRTIADARKAAAEEARRIQREELIEPVSRAAAVEAEILAYAQEEGIPSERVGALAAEAVETLERTNVLARSGWTKDNARALIAPYFRAEKVSKAPVATNGTAKDAAPPPMPRVAAPGRGGGVTAPPPVPKWKRDGLDWPTDPNDIAELAVTLANERWPGNARLTVAELGKSISQHVGS